MSKVSNCGCGVVFDYEVREVSGYILFIGIKYAVRLCHARLRRPLPPHDRRDLGMAKEKCLVNSEHYEFLFFGKLHLECWRALAGQRCAGAYAVSRMGVQKALFYLPMWCSMAFMLNGAKHASVKDVLRTSVLLLEPARVVEEGSKRDGFPTTWRVGNPVHDGVQKDPLRLLVSEFHPSTPQQQG